MSIMTEENLNKGKFWDKLFLTPIIGHILFACIMFMILSISINGVFEFTIPFIDSENGGLTTSFGGPMFADVLVHYIELFGEVLSDVMVNVNPILSGLIVDGIIGGVGAVLGFLPLIMVLLFFIALLEDFGYMARASLLFDSLMKKVGLSGKTIVPMIMSTGCAIPGIMSTRTIKNEKQRTLSASVVSFMPCGAKLPVIAMIAGAFFNNSALITWLSYIIGIAIIFLVAFVLQKMNNVKLDDTSYTQVEIVDLQAPSIGIAVNAMLGEAKSFIIKAGTIILMANTLVWFLSSFTFTFGAVNEDLSNSMLAIISKPIALLLTPTGVVTWTLAAAAIVGLVAKEEVVGVIATVFAVSSNIVDPDAFEVLDPSAFANILNLTAPAALAFLFFNLFTPPCFAAMGAMNTEIHNKKVFARALITQLIVGYTIAMLVFQFGSIIVGDGIQKGFVIMLILLTLLIFYILFISIKNRINSNGEV